MTPATIDNPALRRMESGGVALGMIVRLARTGDIARIAKTTGHDFIFIDGQHAVFDLETISHITQAALGCGVAPLVRVRSWRDPDVGLLLDAGVQGIIYPDINTAEEARAAVAACRFPPRGRRSQSGAYPAFNFAGLPAAEQIAALDRTTLVVCMIETREGLENVERVAAVDGVDVLHIGCSDLLADLGKPGAYGCPEIMEATARVIRAGKAHGKRIGFGGDKDAARQAQFMRDGVQFVTTNTDIAYLMSAASARTAELRKGEAAKS